jgi:hypothetical protein
MTSLGNRQGLKVKCMVEPTKTYEIVLRRDEIADYIRLNLANFRRVFLSLDHAAGLIRDRDDHLTEVLHSLADILRGVLADRYGVDFRPASDLGPDDAVELGHALRVLARLVDEAARPRQDEVVKWQNDRLPGPPDSGS